MDPLSIPGAIAIVGSVASVCYTVLKIISMKRNGNSSERAMRTLEEHDARMDSLVEKVAVLESQMQDNRKTAERQDVELSWLRDLFIKLMKED